MWMTHLENYIFFLLEVVTIVVAILLIFSGLVAIAAKNKGKKKGQLIIKPLNKSYEKIKDQMAEEILSKKELKALNKQNKQKEKELNKNNKTDKKDEEIKEKRVFVIDFDGDIHASQVSSLREEITAVLSLATKNDEVIVKLTSPGGVVHGYGLAASQLERIKKAGIHLTVIIDKVAASGGYMMACVGNKILSAPFAIVGSIGVVGQLPNFHRLLENHGIDFEQHTAGKYKRTLTMFGENDDKGREKFKEDLEQMHQLFKRHIEKFRPSLDLEKIATGEYWLGYDALDLGLIDDLSTSDDYLFELNQKENLKLFEVNYKIKQSPMKKLTNSAKLLFSKFN